MLPPLPFIKTVTDLRYQTPAIFKLLKKNKPVVITRDSQAEAVMLSPFLYEKLRQITSE